MEVKGLAETLDNLKQSKQVEKYAIEYGLVLATNYREFALLEATGGGIKEIARCSIAADEAEFWKKAEHPQTTAEESAAVVCEFLRRALLHTAPIKTIKDIAAILASYARETLEILEQNDDPKAVQNLRVSLEDALSMKFTDDHGAHFFHSTLSQTIFYGLFSAWMKTSEKFDWRLAGYTINTPVMRALFSEIINPDQLGRLHLENLLDGATAALNRVQDKEKLLKNMGTSGAIQHFYEPFLAEFDPELRTELGVWYTPPEIVKYMVERVDRVLRTEMKVAGGLANDNVYILDPCGGTGAYIAEVLRRIHRTSTEEHGEGDLAKATVKEAAMKRILGFEILSASYVVAHWQIGALLEEMGAGLKKDERAAIYLTNALTDWTKAKQIPLPIRGIEEERDAANKIKQESMILVILGNPPYNAFAGTSPKEEKDLVAPYKEGLIKEWGIKKFNLDDLYVRFFRMAENRIAKTGKGIVSFISNYSYTEEPSFVVMRKNLLENFDKLWIENMHGNRNQSERAPDGRPSDTIFSIRGVSPGIRQGVVIALAVKTGNSEEPARVHYRNDIDTAKADERRKELLASLDKKNFNKLYETADPQPWNKLCFRPLKVADNFLQWPLLNSFCKFNWNGLNENRGGVLFDIDRNALEIRMRDYFNQDINWESYRAKGGGLARDAARFNAEKTRKKALKEEEFNPNNIIPYTMRPFDNGFCYHTGLRPIWNEPRPELRKQFTPDNSFLISRPRNALSKEGSPVCFTPYLGDLSFTSGGARYIPFYLYRDDSAKNPILQKTEQQTESRKANLSEFARKYLRDLGFSNLDEDEKAAEIIWLHALAITYSPNYQSENHDGLKIDWPRIPLPAAAKILQESAKLGGTIRDLLDMHKPLDRHLNQFAQFRSETENLSVSHKWGYRDGKGKTYPGVGIIEEAEHSPTEMLDIYLNDDACWRAVPRESWEYCIGGFQPARKWLSYRAEPVLGRSLTATEAGEFAGIIRRITALIMLEKPLNQNYQTAKSA